MSFLIHDILSIINQYIQELDQILILSQVNSITYIYKFNIIIYRKYGNYLLAHAISKFNIININMKWYYNTINNEKFIELKRSIHESKLHYENTIVKYRPNSNYNILINNYIIHTKTHQDLKIGK